MVGAVEGRCAESVTVLSRGRSRRWFSVQLVRVADSASARQQIRRRESNSAI